MKKYQYYHNIKFTLDEKSGYYQNSTIHKSLHRFVWEENNGVIPNGYEIHHIDFNKSNNHISNLIMLSKKEHLEIHSKSLTDQQRQFRRDNMNNVARPKAIEWHKSRDGREWHKKHYEEYLKDSKPKVKKTCIFCGNEFIGYSNSNYCSNKCKSAQRRKSGVDNITLNCIICGNEFITNKNRPAKTCSKSCANKMWHSKKKGR